MPNYKTENIKVSTTMASSVLKCSCNYIYRNSSAEMRRVMIVDALDYEFFEKTLSYCLLSSEDQ